jgi:GMP synthase-like glutamine amidotransferase
MRLHYLQHVPFEGLGNIETWAKNKGFHITRTHLFDDEPFPSTDGFEWLVVMGGPMNIYEETEYPWLVKEKKFIEECLKRDKFVLGVCLGGQLIADVLGGKVVKNKEKEIGWFPVSLTEGDGVGSPFFKGILSPFMAFHWHEDRFELPASCARLAESQGCSHQAFAYNNQAVGLQFHIDLTCEGVKKLIQHCGEGLAASRYVQTADEMVSNPTAFEKISETLETFLDNCQIIKI